MKNIECFSFERNQYFFGKLLTVSDFETEQKYFNDKRRLQNKMMFGTGFACGMETTKVDNSTIVIESGLAFDSLGREIVIDKPALKRLSAVEGFDENMELERPYIYLCVEYKEENKEAVHSLTEAGAKEGRYNKYMEGYKLFLTYDEPKPFEYGCITRLFRDLQTVYEGNGFRVRQRCLKYVPSSSEFDLVVEIEKISQPLKIKFKYELDFQWVDFADDTAKIEFDEEKEPYAASVYTKTYRMKAVNVVDTEGSIRVRDRSFTFSIGEDTPVTPNVNVQNTISIINGDVRERITRDYFSKNLEEAFAESLQEKLYLAKIWLVKWGGSYEIGEIEQIPFGQYVTNTELNRVLNEYTMSEVVKLQATSERSTESVASRTTVVTDSANGVRTGTASIAIPEDMKPLQVLYSQKIAHGLGIGPVSISLGINDEADEGLVFGEASIFKKSDGYIDATCAAKADPKTGVFQIGVRLNNVTDAAEIKVNWIAHKDVSGAPRITGAKSIYVKPDVSYIGVRETVWFEAVVEGFKEKGVTWSVKEANGGVIDKKGQYTAPNVPGVYEIVAKSTTYPELSGSAFVAVK